MGAKYKRQTCEDPRKKQFLLADSVTSEQWIRNGLTRKECGTILVTAL
jgi:hypothetical protein